MAQQHNITTLYIQDPNGGQPQMFKVVGTKAVATSSSGSSSGSSAQSQPQKTILRTITTASQSQSGGSNMNLATSFSPGTILQASKLTNGQIVTVPARAAASAIRPVVVPVSSLQQLKTSSGVQLQTGGGTKTFTPISRPVVIRTQTGHVAGSNTGNQASKITMGSSSGSIQSVQQSRPPVQFQPAQVKLKLRQQPQTVVQQVQVQQQQPRQLQQQTHHIQAPLIIDKNSSDASDSNKESIAIQSQMVPKLQPVPNLNTVRFMPQTQQRKSEVTIASSNNVASKAAKPQQPATTELNHQQIASASPGKLYLNTPILDHSSARKRQDFDFDYSVENKRRKTEKGGKGLRHFSMKVCEKVKAKGRTSYNEVADELVAEFCDPRRCGHPGDSNDDQKNIRRRVYDALNVLMAMDIISKEKKEIHWLGLPTNTAQECRKLTQERSRRAKRIRHKTQQLHDLILQQIAFKRLVSRNREKEAERGCPPPPNTAIHLPFVVVTTANSTTIDCSIANDKTEYLFSFDGAFEVHDDIEVLKRMGLALGLENGQCSASNISTAKSILPKALESYVDDLAKGPPAPCVLSRDELVQQLGGVSLDTTSSSTNGQDGDATGGQLVMETSDAIGGALGGVQRLTTLGGVLQGRVARNVIAGAESPASSIAGDDSVVDDSEGDVG